MSKDEEPLFELDFGELEILEWNYNDFLEYPNSHKVILVSKDRLLKITILDIDQVDFLPKFHTPCQPTIFSKVHLTGEVMPYETHTYVSSIKKTDNDWTDNYTMMTLVKTEAETEELASPITIEIKDGVLGDKYRNMLRGIKVKDYLRLKAELV